MKFKKFSRLQANILLIWCLCLAFFLRVWGLDFGLPYEFHPDEHQYVDNALAWHTTGSMELSLINPPLFTYILSAAYGLWFALSPETLDLNGISAAYFFARLWSVSFGLLTVALAYPTGRIIHSQTAGLLASALLALLFLPAREAHFAVNDTTAAFLVLLALYFGLKLLSQRSWLLYAKAGMAVGLAASAKLTAGLSMLPLLMAHLLAVPRTLTPERPWWRPENRYLALGILTAGLTFLVVSAHILWRLPAFIDTIYEHLRFGAEGYKGLQMAPASGWQYYVNVLGWGIGWPALGVALGGMLVTLIQRQKWAVVLALLPLVLYGYLGGQKILFARFILPAVPPLLLFAAVGLVKLRWSLGTVWQPAVWPVLLVLVVAQPFASLLWFDYLLSRPDTRQLATAWFQDRFVDDTVVVREGYSILPDTLFIQNRWAYKQLYLDERGPTRTNVDHYLSHKTETIALSSFIYDRVRSNPAAEQARQEQLAYLEQHARLVKEFNPYRSSYQDDWFYLDQIYGPAGETWQRLRAGPHIKIYELPYENQPYSTQMPPISVPVQANFDGQLMLLGYDLPTRRVEAGGTIPLTLYWQALRRMDKTYVVFSRLLDNQQQPWGGYDRWPQETANTRLWHPGEVVVDTFNLPVLPEAPAGVYTIDTGLYAQADSDAIPLPLIRDGHPIGQNSVRIGPVKVGSSPARETRTPGDINPQYYLDIQLDQPPVIALRGYDLTGENGRPLQSLKSNPQNLKLTLYWESLARTGTDWSIFAHLRNQAGENVAQKDGPAGGQGTAAYPTSLWDPGELITDELAISLPPDLPPGDYTLIVGLYSLASGERLPVPDSTHGEIVLKTWEQPGS